MKKIPDYIEFCEDGGMFPLCDVFVDVEADTLSVSLQPDNVMLYEAYFDIKADDEILNYISTIVVVDYVSILDDEKKNERYSVVDLRGENNIDVIINFKDFKPSLEICEDPYSLMRYITIHTINGLFKKVIDKNLSEIVGIGNNLNSFHNSEVFVETTKKNQWTLKHKKVNLKNSIQWGGNGKRNRKA